MLFHFWHIFVMTHGFFGRFACCNYIPYLS